MPSSQVFQVPSYSGILPAAKKSSKRKRRAVEPEDENVAEQPAATEPASFTSLTADQAAQYQLAGLDPSDGIPEAPFPHRDKSKFKPREDVRGPTPFISSKSDGLSLRQRHMSVLNTILHHSLLNGDYRRAGRAWAMLLRSGPTAMRLDQTTMDLHRDGRWEIAAEILLRRKPVQTQYPATDPDSDTVFSKAGLRTARDFYERLIVQFPVHPNRMNTQVDFYLAMFSLWIYEVTEKAKSERQRLFEQSSSADRVMENFDPHEMLSDSMNSDNSSSEMQLICAEEVQAAQDIANRLDELLSSPPYDKNPRLLHLRGDIALWMSDSVISVHDEERQKAMKFFDQAVTNGGRIWKTR